MDDQEPKDKSVAFRLPARIVERLRRMAFWEDRRLPSIVSDALGQYLDRHEKRKGKYKPIPKGERVKTGRPRKDD